MSSLWLVINGILYRSLTDDSLSISETRTGLNTQDLADPTYKSGERGK